MMSNNKIESASPHVLPSLPYPDNALTPVISANTIGFHYGKHHKGYADNLNNVISGTVFLVMEEKMKSYFHKAKSRRFRKIKESRRNNATRNCDIKASYQSETEAAYVAAIFGNRPYSWFGIHNHNEKKEGYAEKVTVREYCMSLEQNIGRVQFLY